MKPILVLGEYNKSYYSPYEEFGPYEGKFHKLISNPDSIGLVVFCGGTDVSPAFYGEKPYTGKSSFGAGYDIQRDMQEELAFRIARIHGIPMSGICRGAQFLWAMLGGKLVQDIKGHTGTSHITNTVDSGIFMTTSDHHQVPDATTKPDNVTITAWAGVPTGPSNYCVEAFEADKIVAFQFHPEWSDPSSEEWAYARKCISKLFV